MCSGKNAPHYDMLKAELAIIRETGCAECGGRGHTRRDCPTYERVQRLTCGNRILKSLINTVREELKSNSVKSTLGKRLRYA